MDIEENRLRLNVLPCGIQSADNYDFVVVYHYFKNSDP